MGRGSRHSKNAGTMGSEAQTYHERKAMGHGTITERLGKDAVGNFYECELTLQPAVDPVCTPDGHLYSREAIVGNLLEQKKELRRQLQRWEQQQQRLLQKDDEREAMEAHTRLLAFDRHNHAGASSKLAESLSRAVREEAEAVLSEKRVVSGALVIHENELRMKEMKAFWLPSKTPDAPAYMEKPDASTRCPASGKKLKLKDLVPVAFSRFDDPAEGYAYDPITRQPFRNADRIVVLRKSGVAMLQESYRKCVEPEGEYEGERVSREDVIELRKGGTGFAAHDGAQALQAKKFFALGPGSGRADLRGQHQAAASLGGLRYMN